MSITRAPPGTATRAWSKGKGVRLNEMNVSPDEVNVRPSGRRDEANVRVNAASTAPSDRPDEVSARESEASAGLSIRPDELSGSVRVPASGPHGEQAEDTSAQPPRTAA